ncbi:hypothetical protein E3E12_01405 [Formicincola oecophyllae]|uniref:Uncharacterized protein n=1 Tax=Formicincola oecophyllae TaxID=2558361 RepID=A0A4Y6U7C9_9PROT|nr:hypothetical protein [Formicincola oecophyllae]QDH13074.1 hypothetical protein E3E12_01405 [Formicincola oecophyllae]
MAGWGWSEPLLGHVPFLLPEVARKVGGGLVKCQPGYEWGQPGRRESTLGHYFLVVREEPTAAGVLGFFLNSEQVVKNYAHDSNRITLDSALKTGHPSWVDVTSSLHKWNLYFLPRAAIVAAAQRDLSTPQARNLYAAQHPEALAELANLVEANTQPWRPWS